jgi:transposase
VELVKRSPEPLDGFDALWNSPDFAESRVFAAKAPWKDGTPMPKTRPAYPEQFRREALELVRQGRSIPDVAGSLGVSSQSLRNWKRQDDRDRGERDDGLTSAEREELRELRKRVKRLAQERDILKRATALFARETEIR